MKSIFLSWLGDHDLNYLTVDGAGKGPVIALLESGYSDELDEIHLLHDCHRPEDTKKYIGYLNKNNTLFMNVILLTRQITGTYITQ